MSRMSNILIAKTCIEYRDEYSVEIVNQLKIRSEKCVKMRFSSFNVVVLTNDIQHTMSAHKSIIVHSLVVVVMMCTLQLN